MITLPSRLKVCPENHGRHQWVMHAAHVFVRAGWNDGDSELAIARLLTREPQPTEIADALRKARGSCQFSPQASTRRRSQLRPARLATAKFDPNKLERIAKKLPCADENWLAGKSPLNISECGAEIFLHALYSEGEHALVFSVFRSQGQYVWRHRGERLDRGELQRFKTGCPEGVWFLSNPCNGIWRCADRLKTAFNPSGRTRRSEENITAFRYAVLESDEANPSHWLSALAQMPLPIVSIVTSGGRSFHSLVRVNANTKAHWDAIVRGDLGRQLTILGADPGALTAVRLTRLPCCLRYNDGKGKPYGSPRQQRLLYLNPGADGTPIADLPVMQTKLHETAHGPLE